MSELLERLATALADRYDIEGEIGGGGMATVYLAEDPKHHRKVALKVLRPDLAATLGPDRFLREIEVAANLQHPNILPVYDSGETEGFLYYVMPYVEGESLRKRLSQHGELPLGDAARILRDVADALATAHARGVVHRDIKPENIMLSGRHALVADFGVAKAVVEATGRQTLTTAGVALGTPTYMAPEQAAADPHTDHRADIYALGVTAYELVTGRPPFVGLTAQAILAAHMTEAPTPVATLRPTVPPALGQLIMRCLAKKPADRPQSAEDLLPMLEALSTPSGGVTPTQTQPVQAVTPRRHAVVAVVGVGVLVVAVGIFATQALRSSPRTITVSDIRPVTSEPGVEFQPAISPDGQEVAYIAGAIGAPHLVIRSAAGVPGGGEVRLADTSLQSERFPSWSSDGDAVRFVACRRNGCTWNEAGKLGGVVRPMPLPPQARNLRHAWSRDDSQVAFIVADTIYTMGMGDSSPRRLAVHTVAYWSLHSVAWSPNGRRIAYVNGNDYWLTSGNVAGSSVWIVDVGGGEPQRVTTDDHLNVSPQWLDDDHLLFVSNRDGPRGLYAVEVGSGGARGDARAIPGVADPHSISYAAGPRTLAYARFTARQNVRSYPLGRSAPVSIRDGEPVTTGNQVIESHDVSPDGRWLVYDSNLRGDMDLYRVPLTGGPAEPLANEPGPEFSPCWSPDGGEIAYYRHTTAEGARQYEILVMPSAGGAPRVLDNRAHMRVYPAWSPTGLDIAFLSVVAGRQEIWVLSRDSMGAPWGPAVKFADFNAYPFDWTPDGAGVLARRQGERGRQIIVVRRDGSIAWQYDLTAQNGLRQMGGSASMRYSPDGRLLYLAAAHRDGREGIWAMPAAGGPARLVVAFDDPAVVAQLAGFILISVGPDRLFLTVAEYESDVWVANLKH